MPFMSASNQLQSSERIIYVVLMTLTAEIKRLTAKAVWTGIDDTCDSKGTLDNWHRYDYDVCTNSLFASK